MTPHPHLHLVTSAVHADPVPARWAQVACSRCEQVFPTHAGFARHECGPRPIPEWVLVAVAVAFLAGWACGPLATSLLTRALQ